MSLKSGSLPRAVHSLNNFPFQKWIRKRKKEFDGYHTTLYCVSLCCFLSHRLYTDLQHNTCQYANSIEFLLSSAEAVINETKVLWGVVGGVKVVESLHSRRADFVSEICKVLFQLSI